MKTKQTSTPKKKLAANGRALLQTENDLKDAVLIVSVAINLFVLSLWIALQVTSRYDASLTSFFINR